MRIPPIYRQFQQVLSVYNKRDKEKLFLVALSQVFLAFLDLLGVALLGVIGALSVYGIQSKSPGNRINQLLEFTNLNQYDFQQQVAILGGIAAFVLGGCRTEQHSNQTEYEDAEDNTGSNYAFILSNIQFL